MSQFSGSRFRNDFGTDFSAILPTCLVVFGTAFLYNFTTSMQDVAKWDHADLTRRRSDFNDFREVLVCEFFVFLLFFCFVSWSFPNMGRGSIFAPFWLPKSMNNLAKINEKPKKMRSNKTQENNLLFLSNIYQDGTAFWQA